MSAIETLPFEIPAGVWTDITALSAGRRWIGADKMRFRYGLPETMGGWAKYYASAYTGVPRNVVTWAQLNGTTNTAVGTHKKVELLQAGVKYDVTPFRAAVTGVLAANPFATVVGPTVTVTHVAHGRSIGDVVWFTNVSETAGVDMQAMSWAIATVPTADTYTISYLAAGTGISTGGGAVVSYFYDAFNMINNPLNTSNGSPTISVTWAAHGLAAGDWITISGAATFNGVTANGSWEVASVSDANTFTFTYTSNASAGGAGGGAACRGRANISIGNPSGASMRIWAFAKFGEDMVMCPTPDGHLYVWSASLGTAKRARLLPRAPTADWILCAPEEQFINAYGTNGDNMAQVWCAQADLTQWESTSTNAAGTRQYVSGSKIVAAYASQREIIVITDVMAHSQQFVGGEDVYSFSPLGETTIQGPLAITGRGGKVWWKGHGQYFSYAGGTIDVMPCTMQRDIFTDLNETEARGIVLGIIEQFNELIAFFTRTSTGSTYNDSYAKYNYKEDCWDPGTMRRTAWQSGGIITKPLGLSPEGYLYQHETGVSADGAPLDAYLISGYVSKTDEMGRQVIQYLSKISFDAVMDGNYDIYVRHSRYGNREHTVKGPYRITSAVDQIRPRVRNKFWALEFQTPRAAFLELATEDGAILVQESGGSLTTETEPRDRAEDLLTFWRLGLPTVDRKNAGYR